MPDCQGDEVDIDQAIADHLGQAWRPGADPALDRLVSLGPRALRRAVQLYYTGPITRLSPIVAGVLTSGHSREILDLWAVMLGRLAHTYPEAYLAEIDAGRVRIPPALPTLEIVILGAMDLPAAAALLCTYRAHPEWLVRYHVIGGLGRRTDPASVDAVNAAVTDPERMVRDEAARWVQRRDPDAARVLYRQLLDDPGLAPALRAELSRRLGTAQRLATIKRRRGTTQRFDTGPHA